ncbi:MAG TPA: BTAD domain-containing putative transcriptional regulator [Gaiellaceae bacterium]|jgi:predicted ATPase/DNA-binding SARP family transcriptional activator/Tfp pilus assembly protein PilF
MATQFRILGAVEVLVDGAPAALGAPKQRALLAMLLVNRRRVMSADALVDGLWGESPPASAVQSLQVYVHGLRRALGAERIETAGRGYRAAVSEDELDLDRFERGLERGRAARESGHAEDAADELRQALSLWRGSALADLPEESRRAAEADRLDELRLTALELRYDAELASGRHDAVVAELEALTAEHPYHERFLEQRVLALYRCGRQADALEVYREARRTLSEDLGLEPGPALQELERAVLRQDPSLAAPPAPTRSTRPLPTPPTPLVGRRLELAAVAALFREEAVRLVTLTGPGGTGKTRLGLAVAEVLEPELRDGAIFVSLAPVSSPELLVSTIADALEVREGGRSLAEGVGEHLRERRILLVLDNFEQLLPAAPFVADLLAAAPRLLVLATSRAPLRLAAEHEYPVPPFDTPAADLPFEALVKTDALRLFAARARAVDPAFELDDASAPEVARVCNRLDGLPLAIELAAARSKLLAPGEILERLEREPHLPGTGPRDAPARQRTLTATIGWSYDLLGDDARLAFGRLGVFAGGCTLDAAEQICDASLDTLAALVDNNLLRRRGSRFLMLETVRHFAAERLQEDGDADLRRRHAEWLTELAETMVERTLAGEDAKEWLDRIQPEHDNIRAALAWSLDEDPEITLRLASSLRLFWEVRGHFSEGFRWLEEALPRGAGAAPEVRIRALSASGTIAFRLGKLEVSEERWEEALEIARELGDDLWIARLLSDLGTAAAAREEWEPATALLEESADLFRELDVPPRLATVLGNLGHIAGQQGDYARAIEVTEEALALESRHKPNQAISTYNLGSHNLRAGNFEQAREWLERAVALTQELGFKEVMAYALAAFVRLCLVEGDAARAAYLAGIADRLLTDAGLQLQPREQELFDEAKATAEQELGDAYAAAHDAAFAAPVEEALREGNVLAEAHADP